MAEQNNEITGLTDAEVTAARATYGANVQVMKNKAGLLASLKDIIKEPMLILLVAASTIYFITGNTSDGIFMLSAIVIVSAISLYQDSRSRNALAALKLLTQPHSKVIRNSQTIEISSDDIVMGDMMVIEEGNAVPADGVIIQSNDFSINESILTGESLSVYKSVMDEDKLVYQGTWVAGGLAICKVTQIGNATKLGKIGKSLESIAEERTPLQKQISNFVKKMAVAGVIIFLIVWVINYFQSKDLFDSLLRSLTLAMSILPEEIPVAFTTFMALGAWRLMKLGIIVKQTKTVESLGSATVICVDKTGTITENKMSLVNLFVLGSAKIISPDEELDDAAKALIRTAMWASEPIPFDPMETALHNKYGTLFSSDERPVYKMIHEYPLSGRPPMMTHLFEDAKGNRIIAAKGAPEAIISVSDLSVDEKKQIATALEEMTKNGYRVLAVAETTHAVNDFPKQQQDFNFQCKGLVAFYDPPKKNITGVLSAFDKAGIAVKIITGDNEATTRNIAAQIQFKDYDKSLDGEELVKLSDKELDEQVMQVNIFTRMFPDAKLKVIEALKRNNEVVAMTGDGVNDGPALKAAHIGVAMGKKGTEIAKQASSMIITDDDMAKMADAVAMGRRIYSNLKKAIQYIISIHIPIILTVFIPLALGWVYPNIFTPVHVIFLELIMGPTCSIIYENEPMEKNIMLQKPRIFSNTFFNWRELMTSIVQGLAITAGTIFIYQYAVGQGSNENVTRTMIFLTLISANVLLTLVNRSFFYSVITTSRYKNNLVIIIIFITAVLMCLLLFVKPLSNIFKFESLNASQMLISIAIGFLSVIWYEGVKFFKRRQAN
jgi:Ca2+-transporting ATPase